ncbi:glycoside hydrolase family 43 protein [Litchfieldia salsa]|uniref:Endo-alpha-(1->5)-L-arabinanase n=1 Tax=Litchfieldia salsa TaxID=930152 RepID=A0A1H0T2M0_9BACI|nr:glycoside hydrolase family 43 protein [Litchfieldia salsa]SDP48327.1 arabinan endo-1,5-alpha-L-arabinosidase [Litchfieldia salsa]
MKIKISKKWLLLGLSLAISTALALPVFAAQWNVNDILIHDTTTIKTDSTWRTYATGLTEENGLRQIISSDGLNWSLGERILVQPLAWWSNYLAEYETNQWAPDITFYNNKYWLYYSVSRFGSNESLIGLLSTSTPEDASSWVDEGLVVRSTSANNYNAIDPDLFIDPNGGKLWLTFGSHWDGIKMYEVDSTTMKPTGPIYSLASRNGGAIEAPTLMYKDGYYYLFASFDKCCSGSNSTYKIKYGRSKDVTGPYLDKQGKNMMNSGGTILEQSDMGAGRWKGPGGQDVYEHSPGQWIMVRHAYDSWDNGIPKLRINDLYIDNQGWPSY